MKNNLSASEQILKFLCTSSHLRYKGIKVNAIGLPVFIFEIFSSAAVRNSISRLKKKKYLLFSGSTISVTKTGKLYYNKRSSRMQVFASPFSKNSPKNLLIFFDIPEKRKAEREWLRRQLRVFDYEMIQKSVWVDPDPLPKEFRDYLDKVKLSSNIKFFKLASGYKK